MLSSVLKSERAVEMNISIVRTFVMLRKMASNHQDIMKKLDIMERKYEKKFREIFKALRYLLDTPSDPRNPIGFKQKNK